MIRVLLFVIVLGAVFYAVFWTIGRRNDSPGQSAIPRGPVGPDDDEDFLRQLDWERRRDAHRKRSAGETERPDDPPPVPPGPPEPAS